MANVPILGVDALQIFLEHLRSLLPVLPRFIYRRQGKVGWFKRGIGRHRPFQAGNGSFLFARFEQDPSQVIVSNCGVGSTSDARLHGLFGLFSPLQIQQQ